MLSYNQLRKLLQQLLLCLSLAASIQAQEPIRVIVSVDELDRDIPQAFEANGISFEILHSYRRPDLGINFLAGELDAAFFDEAREIADNLFGPGYVFSKDVPMRPSSSSKEGYFLREPIVPNAPLEFLVPQGAVTEPTLGPLLGKIIVDILGTGIDQDHPDLAEMSFLDGISVIPDSGSGFLPSDFDYINHETKVAGCIGGETTGLLTQLGTASRASFRSALFYEKPNEDRVSVAYVSDAIAATITLIESHITRLEQPYLKNHAATWCFSHSVATPSTRVGDLEQMLTLAWEIGIFTSLSAGNFATTAASISPAGTGEWITFDNGSGPVDVEFWPPTGITTYDLPLTSIGFEVNRPRSHFHLKSGGHDLKDPISIWFDAPGLGSNINTSNPPSFGPSMNNGVDLFAPAKNIPVPVSVITESSTGSNVREIDGTAYSIERGYTAADGTSYSAAYSAALAVYLQQLRPWASPGQIRNAILKASAEKSKSLQRLFVPDSEQVDSMRLSYSDWIERYRKIVDENLPGFFANNLHEPQEDPDGDGVINLVEYLCGMDPRYPDSQHAPVLILDEASEAVVVTMQLAEYLDTNNGANWQLEKSTNLLNWSGIGQGIVRVGVEQEHSGDGRDITARQSYAPVSGKCFYRLKVFETGNLAQ